jgi:uncharacterized protein (UPF0264 family)
MKLLVSVRNAEEARAAAEGGADIVDAKDPGAGALGAVPIDDLRAIWFTLGGRRPLTAALGDAADEASIERAALACSAAGAALVKIGFAGVTSAARVAALLAAACRGARAGHPESGVIGVAYADRVESLALDDLAEAAARAGARGVLVDTIDKNGPGLRNLVTCEALAVWARRAHDAGLLVALAGRLAPDDLPWARGAGADVAGVRGAACDGGRMGSVSARRVRQLCGMLGSLPV